MMKLLNLGLLCGIGMILVGLGKSTVEKSAVEDLFTVGFVRKIELAIGIAAILLGFAFMVVGLLQFV